MNVITKKLSPCESYQSASDSVTAPEKHRIAIHKKHHLLPNYLPQEPFFYKSSDGAKSEFCHGIQRGTYWFVPFNNFIAIYEKITDKELHKLDGESDAQFTQIPLILKSRDTTRYSLVQIIQEDFTIYNFTVPLLEGKGSAYPQRKVDSTTLPRVTSKKPNIDFFAFNFNRSPFFLQEHIENQWITDQKMKEERYEAYGPPLEKNLLPGRPKKRHICFPHEDTELVLYRRRTNESDYSPDEIYTQSIPPQIERPSWFQRLRQRIPPQEERLTVKFE